MPAWTPEFLGAGLKFYLYAPTIAQADASAVATWTGRVNSKNAANATGTEQPTYETNEINGLAVVRSDGVDDDLTIVSHGLTAQPFTVVWIGKVTGGNTSGRMLHATNLIVRRGSTGNWVMDAGVAATYGTYDANTHVHVCTFDGASSRASFDGTATTTNPSTGSPSANLNLFSTGSANFAAADCLASVGYLGALSEENLARLEGWGAQLAGISANLPGGHAYKSAPPVIAQSGAAGVF